MRTLHWLVLVIAVAFGAAAPDGGAKEKKKKPKGNDDAWTKQFVVEKGELAPTGRNPYFVLEPGHQLILEDENDRHVITVLDETKMVDGVETRVVEQSESDDGKVTEISRNYFAISKRTRNVYYFGEDVDVYEDGKVTGHEGSWLAGVDGAKFGLMMPGAPQLRAKYYQELAPGKALDRGEIVSVNMTVKTPAGEFKNCVKIEETSPLEPGTTYKIYAPGIGLIQDGSLKLVKYGKVEKEKK